MTTKEIAEFFGKSADTVQRAAKKAGIENRQGQTKHYTKEEVFSISKVLYKKVPAVIKDAIDLTYANAICQPIVNAEVVTRSDLAAFGASIVTEIMKQFLPILQNQNKLSTYYSSLYI